MSIRLPGADGGLRVHTPRPVPAPVVTVTGGGPLRSRTLFAAAHVVADPFADPHASAVDWDATLAFRRHLWSHGLGVAEAMDTAQRGMGLDWTAAAELIRRSAAEARSAGGAIACGVGTDQLTGPAPLGAVRRAYEEQLAIVEGTGAQPIVMASRALAAIARGPEEYLDVYDGLLRQSGGRVILHWLGPMFDPALEGYWGSTDLSAATDVFLDVVAAHPDKVDGVKISLLDAGREIALRRRLPAGVRCYTGDDFHYPELIAGDEQGFSHALLGVLDPLGPVAADAVRALDAGGPGDGASGPSALAGVRAPGSGAGVRAFRARLDPTVPLARHLFEPPTRYYKTGVVLLAWLAGRQRHFAMVGGLQSARSLPHLARAYELADEQGLFPDPALAEHRMRTLLGMYGVDA
ncbi:dihydrodipicolinate synthase family protein [Streptomyces jumonjinensis]|uniref:Dihydrodipicolinate synthase family protein n=1 Tax=Streptomyces jumonjinensis TaxID=1945 RepID=A0A646KCM2_STRJU|nr:dihydrodipicolinate synthase family protein [Streptomyces jumonjinensis]MQS99879.1 dihydrodipicolinate synthase family protein [Streptomyces jumonjinensis]